MASAAAEAAAARIGAALSDAQYFESSMVREADIRRQLDSNSVKDKLDAMKRVVALISLGKDASSFFPDVVKNVLTSSLEIKKLVYLYLVHYAEEQPDLALLSINSFQKDLSDPSQLIRCLSLRVLSSIRVKVILQIVILAIVKSSKDSSPYVRKAAAHAIAKVCELDPSSFEALEEPLQTLLQDRSVVVFGSAVAVLETAAPDRMDLLHPQYRRLCRSLVDMDAWGQISSLNVLLLYVREHFPNPHPESGAEARRYTSVNASHQGNGIILNGDSKDVVSDFPEADTDGAGFYDEGELNEAIFPDIELLLRSVEPLFFATNTCVVLLCVSLFYHIGSRREFVSKALPAVIKLIVLDQEGVVAALKTVLLMAPEYSEHLLDHLSLFFLSAADSVEVRQLKLKILTTIVQTSSVAKKPRYLRTLLFELRYYLLSTDKSAAACAARAIGTLASSHPPSVSPIVRLLATTATKSTQGAVTSEVVAVLTKLLQQHPEAQALALPQLVRMLLFPTGPQAPAARASIIYLLSEFHYSVPEVAPEALRRLIKSFPEEHHTVKSMTVNLAAKLYCYSLKENADAPIVTTLRKLLEYVTSMGMLDVDYDLRDYSRLLKVTLLYSSKELECVSNMVKRAFTARKPVGSAKNAFDVARSGRIDSTILGSMHHIVGRKLSKWRDLPPWSGAVLAGEQREEPEGGSQGASRDLVSLSSADYHFASNVVEASVWAKDSGISSYGDIPRAESNQTPLRSYDPNDFYEDVGSSDSSGSYETDSEAEDSLSEEEAKKEVARKIRNVERRKEGSFLDLDNLLNDKVAIETRSSSFRATAESIRGKPTKVQQPARDWVADLARVQLSPPGAETSSASEWRRALENWKGAGLQVEYTFAGGFTQSNPNITTLKLRLQNCGKQTISGSISSPSGVVHLSEAIQYSLDPGAVKDCSLSVALDGQPKPIPFTLHDGTEFKIKPELGEVLRPYHGLSSSEYQRLEDGLHGMFVNTDTVVIPQEFFAKVRMTVTSIAFFAEVFGHRSLESAVIGTWAAYLPREIKVPVLLMLRKKEGSKENKEITIWVGCEDALFGSNLVRWIKEKLKTSNSIRDGNDTEIP